MSFVSPLRATATPAASGDRCRFWCWRVVLLVLLVLACGAARSQATQAEVFSARVDAVGSCFSERVRDYATANPGLALRNTGLTAIFVAEQVVKDVRFNPETRKLEGPLMQMSVDAYCEQVLVKPYIRTLEEALKEREKSASGGLAQFGPDDIEADSTFVQGYQDLIGKHNKGHSDITRVALLQMVKHLGIRATPEAVTLVARASQTPDLYRWNDGRYHAHTPEFPAGRPDERLRSISSGIKSFVKLVCDLSSSFMDLAKLGATEDSLFIIGVLGHAVQDLEYHRGMTMSQHAGLSYVVSLNPDSPGIPGAAENERRSVESTVWMMQLLRARVGEARWNAMFMWKPGGDFSFRRVAEEVYGLKGGAKVQDMKVNALASYWSLSLAYRDGDRPRSELDVQSCEKGDGIACWSAVEIRRQVETQMAAGGACQ